ncbi:MAG: cyclase family protein [Actinobacteria bacterium]|nr:MAG: cyclase family protein [Actinomycetota bacterium]
MPLPEDFVALARRVNNWGRWGPDDEIGTLNLITDEVVRRAATYVRTGKRFSLAIPLSEDGPQLGNIPGRTNPERRMITLHMGMTKDPEQIRFSDDAVSMPLQSATHWDALAHVSYGGRMYNGVPVDSVSESGASRLGIANVRTLVSRGVLLDVARAVGVERLEGGRAIGPDDLDAAESLTGVRVEPGDVILIRTGHIRFLKEGAKESYTKGGSPGPGMAAAAWFRERDVAAVATDTIAFEVWPLETKDVIFPVHLLDLVEMGLTQGQNFDLEALADDCAGDGVYAFLLSASPEPFERGLGSPVNPVALK